MSDEILEIVVNQEIMTPYGPGIAAGKVVDSEGKTRGILVSHDPKKVRLPAELLPPHPEGPCYLLEYSLEQLRVVDRRPG